MTLMSAPQAMSIEEGQVLLTPTSKIFYTVAFIWVCSFHVCFCMYLSSLNYGCRIPLRCPKGGTKVTINQHYNLFTRLLSGCQSLNNLAEYLLKERVTLFHLIFRQSPVAIMSFPLYKVCHPSGCFRIPIMQM